MVPAGLSCGARVLSVNCSHFYFFIVVKGFCAGSHVSSPSRIGLGFFLHSFLLDLPDPSAKQSLPAFSSRVLDTQTQKT